MKNTILKIPFILTFLIFIIFLYFLLQEKDPSIPPSALLNKKVPKFESTNLLKEDSVFNNKIFSGKITIINFFASWCSPCKIEHPILMKISKENNNILLIGINHKDKKDDAIEFLKIGNPYNKIGIDDNGKIAIEFGVYGLPETFIVNKSGIIIFTHVGPITEKLYDNKIKKLLSN